MVIDARCADGSLTYGECLRPGRDAGRGAALGACLPPLARQRQPLGARGRRARLIRRLLRGEPPLQLPLPVHPRHHRRDHLAGAERGPARRRSGTGWCWPTSATRGRCTTSAAAAATPAIDRAVAYCAGGAAAQPDARLRRPTATTSGSSARRASTCRSAACRARPTASSPSTTPRPTTSTWSGPRRWPIRSPTLERDPRRCSSATRPT